MRKVLLTGGAGLIGSTLADVLLREEPELEEVIIYDNFSRGTEQNLVLALQDERVRLIKADIRDLERLNAAMHEIDTVFHLAAIRITKCAEDPRLANDVLVNGALNVFEAAVNNDVGKVITSSSASVYGLADEFPTNEMHHPWNNDTIYGAAKAYNEGILKSFKANYGLDYLALRYFNVYGPRMDTVGLYTEVLIRWMQAIQNHEPPIIHGDGSATMDFVYVGDIARANYLAAKSAATDEAINIGTGIETSLRELCNTLLFVMESLLEPEFVESRKINSVTRRKADVTKAKELIGFEAEVNLEEGLMRLVNWFRTSAPSDVKADTQ
jgi:UDP-glucose 4-epimerase